MHSTFSIRANWIWTGDREPQANGCITIENDRIVSVTAVPNASAIDLGPYCILPGLINSHTHLEFSDLTQPVSADGSFADWILDVVRLRRAAVHDRSALANARETDGLKESLSHGVRLVLNVVHESADDSSRMNSDLSRGASSEGPCEANSSRSTIQFAELMGTTSARAKQTWRAALRLRKCMAAEDRHVGLPCSDSAETTHSEPNPDGGLCWRERRKTVRCERFGLSPHAPYTTTAGLVRRAVAKCRQWKLPIMMHLAESHDEMRWIEKGDGPLQELLDTVVGSDVLSSQNRLSLSGYVYELCQAPVALIVHGNYLDESSMEILQANRDHAAVVYCPRTHRHFGHSTYPMRAFRRRGIPVVLGTDSRASSPDLSIFSEARAVRELFPEIPAAEIIAMITTRPAGLLGYTEDWGYLRPGCLGRLTAIRCDARRSTDVLQELLESSHPSQSLDAVMGSCR
jgi:cytosine/adenosine deaminase-related metal-dependent hydrolase